MNGKVKNDRDLRQLLIFENRILLIVIAVFCIILLYSVKSVEGQTLPGDAILSFKVVEVTENTTPYWHWDMKLEVYYTYNPAHKEVIIGGYVLPYGNELQTGHSYWGYESGPLQAVVEENQGSVISGMQRVNIAVKLNVPEKSTDKIKLWMYERDGGEFTSRIFDYYCLWTLPPTPAYLNVTSDPSGAEVVVGIKSINNIVRTETGRIVGVTPLTIQLYPSDISYDGNFAYLICEIRKNGYIPNRDYLELGENGKIEPGKTYEIDVSLAPVK
ncbi:MAG: hypothetical protein H8D45_14495 [Bacteroidetes bacterium]|nr:hypothetical protein [Bacteroidota bacterium]MBL7103311.1 hypothetical protein [Bacteroidales bacterium]